MAEACWNWLPSEIESLLVPVGREVTPDVSKLDIAVRTLPAERFLEQQSRVVLGSIGVKGSEQDDLLDGWKKMRDRRQRIPAALPSGS